MDTAIRELLSEESSDSQDSIISISSSVSSASFVSSTSVKRRASSPPPTSPPIKKEKHSDFIIEIRNIINAEDNAEEKVQKVKQLLETYPEENN